VLQLLVFLLTDALALLAAARAGPFRFIQVVLNGQTRQMLRKFLTAVPGTVGGLGLQGGTGRWELNPRHEQAEEEQLPGIEAFGPRSVAASQQRRQAVTQQLIVLAQELDRFVTLFQYRGMTSALGENDSSQRCRIVGKFQEGRVVHDSDESYALAIGMLQ